MNSDTDENAFKELIQKFKSEWQLQSQQQLKFSEKAKRSLFFKLREIENENRSFVPWELSLNYLPRFSLASTFAALLCLVTFQLSDGDMTDISVNERADSEYSELIAGNDYNDEIDSNDLIVDEEQEGEI